MVTISSRSAPILDFDMVLHWMLPGSQVDFNQHVASSQVFEQVWSLMNSADPQVWPLFSIFGARVWLDPQVLLRDVLLILSYAIFDLFPFRYGQSLSEVYLGSVIYSSPR